jgi:hypothetical protein
MKPMKFINLKPPRISTIVHSKVKKGLEE